MRTAGEVVSSYWPFWTDFKNQIKNKVASSRLTGIIKKNALMES